MRRIHRPVPAPRNCQGRHGSNLKDDGRRPPPRAPENIIPPWRGALAVMEAGSTGAPRGWKTAGLARQPTVPRRNAHFGRCNALFCRNNAMFVSCNGHFTLSNARFTRCNALFCRSNAMFMSCNGHFTLSNARFNPCNARFECCNAPFNRFNAYFFNDLRPKSPIPTPPPSPHAAFSKEKSSQRPPAGYFAARVTIDLHDPGTPPTPDPTPPLSPPPEIISANGSTPRACRPTFSLPICAIRARTNIPCHPHSSKTHTSVAYMDVHKPTPLSVIH